LTILLGKLETELNRVTRAPAAPQPTRSLPWSSEKPMTPLQGMRAEFQFESSFLGEIMKSQLEYVHQCEGCGHRTCVYEHPFTVGLDVRAAKTTKKSQSLQRVEMAELLKEFCGLAEQKDSRKNGKQQGSAQQRVEKHCSKCSPKASISHSMRASWTSLPPVLTFVLQRYLATSSAEDVESSALKVHTRVDFPVDCLDMQPYLSSSAWGRALTETKYQLVGVVDHIGRTVREGHYTCTCARYRDKPTGVEKGSGPPNGQCWFRFDDRSVQQASKDQVATCSSYILLYRRIDGTAIGNSKAGKKEDVSGIPSDDDREL